jgi:hypothetical protein
MNPANPVGSPRGSMQDTNLIDQVRVVEIAF